MRKQLTHIRETQQTTLQCTRGHHHIKLALSSTDATRTLTYSRRTRLTGAFLGIPTPRQYTSPLLDVQMQPDGHCALDTTTFEIINSAINSTAVLQWRCIIKLCLRCSVSRDQWLEFSRTFYSGGAPRKIATKLMCLVTPTQYTR